MTNRGKPPATRAASPAELRQIYQTLLQQTEEERAHVARQIHNDVGQSLTAIKMALKGAQRQINAGQATVGERLELAERLLDETIQRVRQIAADLRPGLLDHFGLGAAVEWQMQQFCAQSGRPYHLQVTVDEKQITPVMAIVAFRILQEALATMRPVVTMPAIHVDLTMNADALHLAVQTSASATPAQPSFWPDLTLLALYERAQAIGGATFVETTETDATLRLWLPLQQTSEAPR